MCRKNLHLSGFPLKFELTPSPPAFYRVDGKSNFPDDLRFFSQQTVNPTNDLLSFDYHMYIVYQNFHKIQEWNF